LKFRICGVAAAIALMISVNAHVVIIVDTFNTTQALSTAGKASGTVIDGANIRGAEREASISGTGTATLDINVPSAGILEMSNNSRITSTAVLRYDGVGTGVGAAGLGGVDFTQSGSQNAFELAILFDDLPMSITIEVASAGGSSKMTVVTPGGIFSGSVPLLFEYSSFSTLTGAGADFTGLDSIELVLDANIRATDIALDFFGTAGPTPTLTIEADSVVFGIAEPSPLSILSLGLIGLACYRRRKAA
jgi:hypothetical protein